MNKLLLLSFLLGGLFRASAQNPGQSTCKPLGEGVLQESMRRANHLQLRQQAGEVFSIASANYTLTYARCHWYLDPARRHIRGQVTHYLKITQNTSSITLDLHNSLQTDSVLYRGNKITFSRTGNHGLVINFPSSLPAGSLDSVSIFYQGDPGLSGYGSFIQDQHGGVPILWTLSEPYGARDWWPCRNGLDDKIDSLDIVIHTPETYRASSNGMLQSETVQGGERISWYRHRYAITTYLVAVAVTNYVTFTDYVQLGSRNLPVITYVYPENEQYFKDNTPITLNALKVFHDAFGDYPFLQERYGHTQWNWGGGMEHQTNSFMGDMEENLQGHELAHQWFGDVVTCGSWSDIWLNEGFASWAAVYAIEKSGNPDYKGWLQWHVTSATSQPDGSVYVTDTSTVNRIFDYRLTYMKGACLVRMLQWKLGDDHFFTGVRNYLQEVKLKGGYAKVSDLQRNLESVSGQSLDTFFNQWYYGQGYPSYDLKWSTLGGGWVRTQLSQTTSHPSVPFYHMPVPVVFKNGTQEKTVLIHHNANGQLNQFEIGFEPVTAEIDPELWLLSANNRVVKQNIVYDPNEKMILYPNPVTDPFFVRVQGATGSQADIRIVNMVGQVLYRKSLPLVNNSGFTEISSASLARGVYALQVFIDGKRYATSKFLK
jgi:aminopeptidase N